MSECRILGKDKIIFVTKEDHATPSTVQLVSNELSAPGLILENGEINWNCPCLGGMATGPCGVEFREAFSCFHYSDAKPKGSDCFDSFSEMQTCFAKYPEVYKASEAEDAFNETEPDITTDLIESVESHTDNSHSGKAKK